MSVAHFMPNFKSNSKSGSETKFIRLWVPEQFLPFNTASTNRNQSKFLQFTIYFVMGITIDLKKESRLFKIR